MISADHKRCPTHPGDLVFDPFGGSGTTLIAAEKTGRHVSLIELDPKYVDVIVRRWQEFTGEAAVLESSGQNFDALNSGETMPVDAETGA